MTSAGHQNLLWATDEVAERIDELQFRRPVRGGVHLPGPEVYQAGGMIIDQLEVTPDAALATLRAHAFVHERPIDAVARDVVARTLRFTKDRS